MSEAESWDRVEPEFPKLTVIDGELYLGDDILLVFTSDPQTIKWPFCPNGRNYLANVLYDLRETGRLHGDVVLLPDGELFDIDEEI